MHTSILILGGGITGLSTAYHLEKAGCADYLLVEKQPVFGGLCASVEHDGFTLDYGGHLLHLHTPQGKALVRELLGDHLLRHKRQAWIFLEGHKIPFPFQANLWALPEPLREKCVQGLAEIAPNPPAASDFETWCLTHFGRGIYDVFMRPYNEKLWGRPLKNLTDEWCPSFVPVPTSAQLQSGARAQAREDFGYNAYFYYPASGGCGALTEALAAKVTRKRSASEVQQIDLTRKEVLVNGKIISYDTLVNTLPLPAFMRMVKGADNMQPLAQDLQAQPISVMHLAIARETEPFSWIYFSDKKLPFHRIGLQSGFSPKNAPVGTSLFYLEFSGLVPPDRQTEQFVRPALEATGLLTPSDKIIFSHWQTLPYAYAVYDHVRTTNVSRLTRFLAQHHCFCAGRYGKWEYSFMEYNLAEGAQLAQKLV